MLQGETYLLEANWEPAKTPATDLHAFEGKLQQKAAWASGLFVSNSGFTDDGLVAFGRGKRVVYMDGLDLFDTLDWELPLNLALDRKVRRADITVFRGDLGRITSSSMKGRTRSRSWSNSLQANRGVKRLFLLLRDPMSTSKSRMWPENAPANCLHGGYMGESAQILLVRASGEIEGGVVGPE